MNIYYVPLRDGPQTFAIALSGVIYRLRIRYNSRLDLWMIDIADSDGKSMLRGLPMVTGCDLLAQYHHLGFQGALVVYNADGDAPPDFAGLRGSLLYVTGVDT